MMPLKLNHPPHVTMCFPERKLRSLNTTNHTTRVKTVPRRWVRLGQAVGSPIWQAVLPVARHGGRQAWGAPHHGVNLFTPGHGELKREGLLCPARPRPPCLLELWKPPVAPGCCALANGEFPFRHTYTHTITHILSPAPETPVRPAGAVYRKLPVPQL